MVHRKHRFSSYSSLESANRELQPAALPRKRSDLRPREARNVDIEFAIAASPSLGRRKQNTGQVSSSHAEVDAHLVMCLSCTSGLCYRSFGKHHTRRHRAEVAT